ncbi:MAG: sugar phosphate isomerase/epimerase [Bacteroidales bacterium]
MKKSLLLSSFMVLALAGVLLTITYSCQTGPKGKNIGLQLYSLRDTIWKDLPGTIEKVGKMGYKTVETAGYGKGKLYGLDPAEFKALCEKNGLVVISAHTGMPLPDSAHMAATMAWWDTCIAAHAAAGVKYIVQPFMGGDAYDTLPVLKAYCDYFNAVGEKCNAKGIRFGYHNHDKEFSTQLEGNTIYDFMLANTDPAKVMFQMDLYWTVVGGKNPVDYFNKYPGRFESWHIKDKAEVGASGMMDFASIWAAAATSGMKYGIVEVEEYNFDPYVSCQKSLEFLNAAEYVKMPE